jgi:hypothetical protein
MVIARCNWRAGVAAGETTTNALTTIRLQGANDG